ncbi:transposase, MuDR, MULE transposase domain protein [Tanacetum coccineum]
MKSKRRCPLCVTFEFYSIVYMEMMLQKFNLEANYRLNLSVKLSLFDYTFDITDDAEGQYKGTNLLVVGMDGNNQIVPNAFGICKGETGQCCLWWMSVLKECIGDNPNLLFISDSHPAIALAVHNEFLLAFHGSYTPEEFTRNINILQAIQPDAYHKLCDAGPQRWSRAHCPLIRYNYMTSNSVESVNACTVLKRKLPITMLAETYQAMVQDWYFKR